MARKPQGRFWGVPYNWSRPARKEIWKGLWDPDEPRFLTPKNWGWGYSFNFAALRRRLQRRRR